MCWWQKNAGYIFEERGLNLYELIAQAHNECWDEEKSVPSLEKEKPRQNAVRVDYSRETSVREKQEKKPNYKYGQAMKDAKASYKKGSAAAAEPVEAPKRRRKKKLKKEEWMKKKK